jgi:hypothetical protein
MRKILIGLAPIFLLGCSVQNNSNSTAALEAKVADLQKTVDDLKPGLGEIMGVIQQHHAKLYYAGTKSNWPLAQYELGEIQEGLDDAVKYYPRFQDVSAPLTELVPTMTKGSLAQVGAAIEKRICEGLRFALRFLLQLPPGRESSVCKNSASNRGNVQQPEIHALGQNLPDKKNLDRNQPLGLNVNEVALGGGRRRRPARGPGGA